jgi:putative hemolysin
MSAIANYVVRSAQSAVDLQRAQALRFALFELGNGPAPAPDALDCDAFDSAAEHLLLTTADGELVGTCRLLTAELLVRARLGQRAFYSATEFDFASMPTAVLAHGAELGRLVIAEPHRNGTALMSLWTAIGHYMQNAHKRYLFGCVSIAGTDLHAATQLLQQLHLRGAMHPELQIAAAAQEANASMLEPEANGIVQSPRPAAAMPPLLRLYLAAGAKICSAPAVDRNFGVCDVLALLDTEIMHASYRTRFFGERRTPVARFGEGQKP